MAIISKQKIKKFKLFIVSPLLEKLLLISYIITIPCLALVDNINKSFTDYFMSKTINSFGLPFDTSQYERIGDVKEWIINIFIPSYFTNDISPNKPLFPVYIFETSIENSDCLNYNPKNFVKSCSAVENNLDSSQAINAGNIRGEYQNYYASKYLMISPTNSSISNLTSKLDNIITNNTVFFSVQSIYYNSWDNIFISFKLMFETDGTSYIRNKIESVNVANADIGVPYLVFYSIFTIQVVIMTLRILFEFSIIPNKFTFMAHASHFTLQYLYIFWSALDIGPQILIQYSENIQAFKTIDLYIYNYRVAKILIGLIFIFYPFRLFTWISWIRQVNLPMNLFVVMYRTIPVLGWISFTQLLFALTQSLGIFLNYKQELWQTSNYIYTLWNYPFLDMSILSNKSNNFVINFHRIYEEIGWLIISTIFCLSLLLGLVTILDATKRSLSFEIIDLLPLEQEIQERQEELKLKFDRFLRELSGVLNKNKEKKDDSYSISQDKMVIWLDYNNKSNSKVDLIMEKLENRIKVMVFYTPEEVEEFLKYLFRLKPRLLNSQAGTKFRMVAETDFEFGKQENKTIQQLLEWLKGVGCRVPFLLFNNGTLDRDIYIQMKKKYPTILSFSDIDNALKFCRMEQSLNEITFYNDEQSKGYNVLEEQSESDSSDLSTPPETNDN